MLQGKEEWVYERARLLNGTNCTMVLVVDEAGNILARHVGQLRRNNLLELHHFQQVLRAVHTNSNY
jgi:hypothetical protein